MIVRVAAAEEEEEDEEVEEEATAGLPLVERGSVQLPEFVNVPLGRPRDIHEAGKVDVAWGTVMVCILVDVIRDVRVVVL